MEKDNEQSNEVDSSQVNTEATSAPEVVAEAVEDSNTSNVSAPTGEIYGLSAVEFRGLLIKLLLGSLVMAAGVAVIAILIGSMTDVVWRSISTILVAIFHILIVFGIVSMPVTEQNEAARRSSNLLMNATVTLVVLSFFTAIFHIWEVFTSDISIKLYMTYVVVFAGLVHAKVLMDAEAIYTKLRPYVYANYAFVALVTILILGVIYAGESAFDLLDSFYGRLLAASAVVDVTISMVIAVLQKLHAQKNPQLYQNAQEAHFSAGRIIVVLLLMLIFGWPLLSFLISIATNNW